MRQHSRPALRAVSSALLLAALSGSAAANDLEALVDFESGALGWSGPQGFGGATNLVPTGGNGGGAGLQTVFNDFGITFRNSTPAFARDYSVADTVSFSVDVLVNDISSPFSGPVPRPFLLELRDFDSAQGGFPWTSVWYLFDNISNSTTWETFAITIGDPTSTTLPPGWAGFGAENAQFEPILPPGVTFADVLAGVDEVAYTTLQPGFFFTANDYDLVLDSVSVATTGGVWCELGSGLAGGAGVPSLDGFGNQEPGSSVALSLYDTVPGSTAFLAVGNAQVALPFFGGTLLTSGDVTLVPGTTNGFGHLPSIFAWPTNVPSGKSFFWQYGVLDPAAPGMVALSNGLQSTAP